MGQIGESHVEEAALAWLSELGYNTVNGLTIGPDATAPERASYGDVVLIGRLNIALRRLNPTLPEEALAEARAKVLRSETQSLLEETPPAPLPRRGGARRGPVARWHDQRRACPPARSQ
ncbi:hypothetical protein WDZ11_22175 (plasmid) [Roseomonas mucosa]|uniref:hypothetical protein n=1 Tax=Roseomonas mucosa TaxID=207340 RepID=UPI0030D04968